MLWVSIGVSSFKYLGVPLITSKLNYAYCVPLLEKVDNRIRSWEHKTLSFAGRLQLVISILCSLQVYWASYIFLPKKITKDIEQKFQRFLWSGKVSGSYFAEVSWREVCCPKDERDLGIKNLHSWNLSLMARHIWILVCVGKKGNMWEFVV